MAEAGRAFANEEVPMLAKIIAPRIGIVATAGLVADQRHAVDEAAVGRRVALASEANATGPVAISVNVLTSISAFVIAESMAPACS